MVKRGFLVAVLMTCGALLPAVAHSHTLAQDCPKLIVICPTELPESGKTYVVKLRAEGGNPDQNLTYNWSVSSGEIVEGQGTTSLKIRLTDTSKGITATVEVGGMESTCEKIASCSFLVT